MILERAAISHPGVVRPNNEDALGYLIPERPEVLTARGALFSVADGVGGLAAGEVASQTAVTVMADEYFSPRAPFGIEAALRLAAEAANRRVYVLAQATSPELSGMQTTLSALVIAGRQAYIAHAGDTRVYRLRRGTMTQLTADHSEAAELLRLRLITPVQAANHPRRSVLTRTFGGSLQLRPDFGRHSVEDGDVYLLCSDGLWGEVPDADIAHELEGPVEDACDHLIEMACSRGGGDNVSVQCIRVVEAGQAKPASPPGRIARLLSGLRGG